MDISEIKNDDLKTLAQCSNTMKKHGYDKDFQITDEGLKCMDGEDVYAPEDVKIVNFYRFEGESDPADMAILYVMETKDGMKGTLVDAFGTYSARRVQDFILQVEEIQKRTE